MHSGKVCGISDDYDKKGTHVRVDVEHGKRKRSKGPDGEKGELMNHSLSRSSVVMPKEHAAKFRHGQRVRVELHPEDEPTAKERSAPPSKGRSRIRGAMTDR